MNKDTFCLAPWFSLFVDADKKIKPCCLIKKGEQYDFDQIEDYFQSSEIKALRKDLIKGVKNERCKKCWNDEESSGDSLRLITNRTLGQHSDINIKDQIDSPHVKNIKSFDLVLGNLCNLKCRMCAPDVSSQLLAEATLNPSLKQFYEKGQVYNQSNYNWPKQEQFVTWCKTHLPQSIHIKFTGGEPLINPWIKDVLHLIPDQQKKKCVLHFTSNLTTVDEQLFRLFEEFKEVWLSVSVEGIWATLDYIRDGHTWIDLSSTIKRIIHMQIPNLKLKINHVVQAPSYQSIMPMVRYFDSLGLEIRPLMLNTPKHFHISALTSRCKQHFIEQSLSYEGFNSAFVEYVAKVSKLYITQDKRLTELMLFQLGAFDKVRGKDYNKIIPVDHIKDIV